MNSRLSHLALGALRACAASAQAATAIGEHFTLSGFGTLGAVLTNTVDAQFVTPGQTRGATNSPATHIDSKLGVQLGAKAGDTFSATAQVLVRDTYQGNWKPGLEWLFGKVQFNPTVAPRVGRIGTPLFAVSDFRNVGYANTFLRPPVNVCGQVAFSNFDGADLLLQHTVGGVALAGEGQSRPDGHAV